MGSMERNTFVTGVVQESVCPSGEESGAVSALKQRDLPHLFMDVFLERYGPKQELDNASAYAASFISCGIHGWINQWIARGTQQPAELVAELLAAQSRPV